MRTSAVLQRLLPPAGQERLVPRWLPLGFLAAAVLLVPWSAYLLLTLPDHAHANHWALAWTGFDVGMLVALFFTAFFSLRRSVLTAFWATMTGTITEFPIPTPASGAVDIAKTAKDVWQAAPCRGPLTVVARIYAYDVSVRTAYLDTTRGYFNGAPWGNGPAPWGWGEPPRPVAVSKSIQASVIPSASPRKQRHAVCTASSMSSYPSFGTALAALKVKAPNTSHGFTIRTSLVPSTFYSSTRRSQARSI